MNAKTTSPAMERTLPHDLPSTRPLALDSLGIHHDLLRSLRICWVVTA